MRQVNGAAVRAIREAAGISLAELAGRALIAKSHLSQLERGVNGASMPVARRIATELKVPIDAITTAAPDAEAVPA
jgi:transcriptional regulator with XRE-family HTH domain